MSTQRFLEDATRALLLLLHANEGKEEMLKLNLYEFEMIKKMSQEGSPAGDERIRTLIAAGDAATDMTTFAKIHKELVEKFEQHVPDMTFVGKEYLNGFFTELTFDKDGQPRKSERRVLSNIAPDAQTHIGYAVMLYIFQRQAELSKTAMTSMGATKTAQAIFKMKKKSNGGARVKFLNYATFYAYYGLVELVRENENGKPIIMLHLTDEGIAWWSRICMRTRALFVKHEARIAQLQADLAALTLPGPKAPTPSSPLLGVAVAAILALAASGGGARADAQDDPVANWAAVMSQMDIQPDPAYVIYDAPPPIDLPGIIATAMHSSAPTDFTAPSGRTDGTKARAADRAVKTIRFEPFKQTSGVASIVSTDVTIQYLAPLFDPKVDTAGVSDWISAYMRGQFSGLEDPSSTDGAFDISSNKLGRPIDRLGETDPLVMTSLGAVTWSFKTAEPDTKIEVEARFDLIGQLGETEPLDIAFPGAAAWSVYAPSEDVKVDLGARLSLMEQSDWMKSLVGSSEGVGAGSIYDSRVGDKLLASSIGRPIDRLGETEPLIMASITKGDT